MNFSLPTQKKIRNPALAQNDLLFHNLGFHSIVGVDEVGRGSLAGPVVCAAVILPNSFYCPDLDDSKKLTAHQRLRLFDFIRNHAKAFSLAFVPARIIDQINILSATFLAMKKAISLINHPYDCILVDGKTLPPLQSHAFQKAIPQGDSSHLCIAAASVIAKVSRDFLMMGFDNIYKGYEFKKHKGYGTILHRSILEKKGPCPIHRLTFAPLKFFLKSKKKPLQDSSLPRTMTK